MNVVVIVMDSLRDGYLVIELLQFIKPKQSRVKKSDKLAGKIFVVTGTLETMSRQQVEQKIKQAGGKTSSSVSQKTDFVLAGENPGSKLDKAGQLGVKVIDEKHFWEMTGTQ